MKAKLAERPTPRAYAGTEGADIVLASKHSSAWADQLAPTSRPPAVIPFWVFTLGLSCRAIALYAVFLLHRNGKTGTAWMGRPVMHDLSQVAVNKITKTINELIRAGLIVKKKRSGRNGPFPYEVPIQNHDAVSLMHSSESRCRESSESRRRASNTVLNETSSKEEKEGALPNSGPVEELPMRELFYEIRAAHGSNGREPSAKELTAWKRFAEQWPNFHPDDALKADLLLQAPQFQYGLAPFIDRIAEKAKRFTEKQAERQSVPATSASPNAKPRAKSKKVESWQIRNDFDEPMRALVAEANAIRNNQASWERVGDDDVMFPEAKAKLVELERRHAELKAERARAVELNEGLPA